MERDSAKNPQREKELGLGLTGLLQFLSQAHDAGVRSAVLCPGGRNAPMVQALEICRTWGWEILPFFEERSAGFFALARAKRDQRPVLVSVTSGTAVANLLPAAIEAQATDVPLIFATADRPRSHRGSGSPQSMQQVGLFGIYAKTLVDWQEGEEFPAWNNVWDRRSPIHINLCHDEPLWSASVPSTSIPNEGRSTVAWPILQAAFPAFKKPLVLLGSLAPEERAGVEAFCRWYGAPVLAEASSGLREVAHDNWMHASERIVRRYWKQNAFDGVIRFGGVPSWRLWRDLENSPVQSFGRCQWSGLPGNVMNRGELSPWLSQWMKDGPQVSMPDGLQAIDREHAKKLSQFYTQFPQSEPTLVRELSLRANGLMYLGNSRPVRDWNEHATRERKFDIQENRGLNGIDGQVSSFFGHCSPKQENWALLGDLTALYDLSGPWALRHLQGATTRLVVMNNSGGRIFERLFPSETFVNAHDTTFEGWAQIWKLPYRNDLTDLPDQVLVELLPVMEQTRAFRDAEAKL